MPRKSKLPVVPKFSTEAEEAKWWYENRARIEATFRDAMRAGTVVRGTAQRLTREARESRNITIRMPVRDLERAGSLAEQ